MQKYFPLFLFVCLLAACQSAAPAATTPVELVETPTPAPTETLVVDLTNTPIPEPSATATERPLTPEILALGLSPEDLKNFAKQPDGSVIDTRDGAIAYDTEGKLVRVRYGTGWEVAGGKMQVKEVSLDGLNCVKEEKSCVNNAVNRLRNNTPSYEVNCVSTEAFESGPLYDPNTGEYLGLASRVWAETMDQKRNKTKFLVPAQVILKSGENALYAFLAFFNDQNKEYVSISPFTTVAAEQLTNILPAGYIFDLYFPKNANPPSKALNSFVELSNRFYQPNNIKRMGNYFSSVIGGSSKNPDPLTTFIPFALGYPKPAKPSGS